MFGVPLYVGGNLTEEGEILFRHGYPLVGMSADWKPLWSPCAQANACAQGRTKNFSFICLHFKKFFLPLPLNQYVFIMKKVPLYALRLGDSFRLKDDINSPIWVRGHYDLSSRKFSIFTREGIFRELFRKSTYRVFVESY